MNFIRFLENRFQELSLENETKIKYDLRIDSEIKAIHEVLTKTRNLTKLGLIPKVLYDYVQVSLGKKPEPKPVIVNKLQEQREKELEKKITPIQSHINEVPQEPA